MRLIAILFLAASISSFAQDTDASLSTQSTDEIRSKVYSPNRADDFNQDMIGGKMSRVERATTSGTNTYTASVNAAVTSYQNGYVLFLKIGTAPTGSSTLNLNSIGAKKIFKTPTVQVGAADLGLNQSYVVTYDTSLDSGAGGFLIMGSPAVWGSITGSIGNQTDLQDSLEDKRALKTKLRTFTSDHTLVLADAEKIIFMDDASANDLTIPLNASVNLPLYTTIWVSQVGAGLTTIAATPGVTLESSSGVFDSPGQDTFMMLYQWEIDSWKLYNGTAILPIDLTDDVTGILPVANGGTGDSSYPAGEIIFGNGTSPLQSTDDMIFDGSDLTLSPPGNFTVTAGDNILINETVTSKTLQLLNVDGGSVVLNDGITIQGNGVSITSATSSMQLISAGGVSVVPQTHLLIGGHVGGSGELRIGEANPGANYSAFTIGTQSSDITYRLPLAAPTSNGLYLSSTTSGNMSWSGVSTRNKLPASIKTSSFTLSPADTSKMIILDGASDLVITLDDFTGNVGMQFAFFRKQADTVYFDANGETLVTSLGALGVGENTFAYLYYNSIDNEFYLGNGSSGSGGGGGGSVNSVSGTTNRITSTGGTDPVIDISATFEALLGKVAQRIDQNNASTTSAQLASVISDETGTGNLVYSNSPTFTTPNIGSATGSVSGNAGTATALATGRTISITGDLAYTSPSFDGSGNVTAAGTLATVNSNTGSFGSATEIPIITVNGKGLITAVSTVAPSSAATAWQLTGTSTITTPTIVGNPFFQGNVLIGASGASITANTPLDVRGLSGNNLARFASSSNTERFLLTDAGKVVFTPTDNGNNATALTVNSTLTATANNDNLYGTTLNTTSSIGSFTGVATVGFRIQNAGTDVYKWFNTGEFNVGTTVRIGPNTGSAFATNGSRLAVVFSATPSTTEYFHFNGNTNVNNNRSATLNGFNIQPPTINHTSGTANYRYNILNPTVTVTNLNGGSIDVAGINFDPTLTVNPTNLYGITIVPTSAKNGFGVAAPTARVEISGGSSTIAPLVVNSGTLLSTTKAGAIENDGTHIYYTAANSGTRYQLDQQVVSKTLNSTTTAVANVGTGEDVLYTYTIPSNTLSANKDMITMSASGRIGASGNSKRIRIYYGSTLLFDTGSLSDITGSSWDAYVRIYRVDATNQKAVVTFISSNSSLLTSILYSTPAETLSGTVVLQVTGEAVSNNEVLIEMADVNIKKAE
jgi:hypothetical protein